MSAPRPAAKKTAMKPPSKNGWKTRARNRSSPTREFTLADGREVRRFTLYLPLRLAQRLAKYSATHDRNMSDVIAEALAAHLAK